MGINPPATTTGSSPSPMTQPTSPSSATAPLPSTKQVFSTGCGFTRSVTTVFDISPSGSTVRVRDGLTITWSAFLSLLTRCRLSWPGGPNAIPTEKTRVYLQTNGRRTSLSTPARSSSAITMEICHQTWNPNSGLRRVYRQSAHPAYLHCWLRTVERLEATSSPLVATWSARYELADRFTRLTGGSCATSGVLSEYPSPTTKGQKRTLTTCATTT